MASKLKSVANKIPMMVIHILLLQFTTLKLGCKQEKSNNFACSIAVVYDFKLKQIVNKM